LLNTCQFGCCVSVTQNLWLTDHGNENNDDGDDDDDDDDDDNNNSILHY